MENNGDKLNINVQKYKIIRATYYVKKGYGHSPHLNMPPDVRTCAMQTCMNKVFFG